MTLEEWENSDDGWVEWPSFPENENKFDWSLSYEDMGKQYHPVKKKRFNYKQSTSFPPKKKNDFTQTKAIQEKREQVTGGKYLNYMGKDCPCVGFIDRAFSLYGSVGVCQYKNAYYHSGEEKYIFEVNDGVLAYPKAAVEKFIKPFFSDAQDVGLSVNTNTSRVVDKEHQLYLQSQTPEQFELEKKHGWRVAKLLTDPESNFHCE